MRIYDPTQYRRCYIYPVIDEYMNIHTYTTSSNTTDDYIYALGMLDIAVKKIDEKKKYSDEEYEPLFSELKYKLLFTGVKEKTIYKTIEEVSDVPF